MLPDYFDTIVSKTKMFALKNRNSIDEYPNRYPNLKWFSRSARKEQEINLYA
jgi:hypothetical protein